MHSSRTPALLPLSLLFALRFLRRRHPEAAQSGANPGPLNRPDHHPPCPEDGPTDGLEPHMLRQALPHARVAPLPPVLEPAPPATVGRQALLQKLQQLKDAEPPRRIEVNAMCYRMAAPPERAEYICPTCGEKTLYAQQVPRRFCGRTPDLELTRMVSRDLPACRRLITQVVGVKVRLDESRFCAHCQPGVAYPSLGMRVLLLEGGEEHVVWEVSRQDVELLVAFTEGKEQLVGAYGASLLLCEHLPRLQALLGISLAELTRPQA